MKFIEVAFPLPVDSLFSYAVPMDLYDEVEIGKRVVAPFGQRTLTGFIVSISNNPPETELDKIKKIVRILDKHPVFDEKKLKFFTWLSSYYLSSLGEALKLTDPYGTSIQSEKQVFSDKETVSKLIEKEKNRNTSRYKVMELLLKKDRYTLKQLQNLTGVKSILVP
ncbi:MAG: primosomal protein N', partial [Ignavibacteriaceae bacterium]|nr:primosomal protein N' [Ignavibacteriaceae bacterium]